MRRRELLAAASAVLAVAGPRFARAADRKPRLGVILAIDPDDPLRAAYIGALEEGLRAADWVQDRNIRIDYFWAAGDAHRAQDLAKELVASKPDVIVAHSSPVATALKNGTTAIPIVFVSVTEPLDQGLVSSLGRPGGNVTGFTNFEFSMGGKWLEILKEIAPGTTRATVIFNPDTAPGNGKIFLRSVQAVAASFAIEVSAARVHNVEEIEQAVVPLGKIVGAGLIVPPDAFLVVHRERIIALAAQYRVPTMYQYDYFAESGGLIAYGSDVTDLFRRAAAYVDRILKGANPGDLPVQAPTKFRLVVNLKTAKALGLTVPPLLLASADEVIE
ncbi:MAG: ABC transporter substrate-binding protein [Alphaproteobacteria bacterium]